MLGDTLTFSYGENEEDERKFGPVVIRLGGPVACPPEEMEWSISADAR